MKLYLNSFDCIKTTCFDLDLLPTEGLQREFSPFIYHRGNTSTYLTFSLDLKAFKEAAGYLCKNYPDATTLVGLPETPLPYLNAAIAYADPDVITIGVHTFDLRGLIDPLKEEVRCFVLKRFDEVSSATSKADRTGFTHAKAYLIARKITSVKDADIESLVHDYKKYLFVNGVNANDYLLTYFRSLLRFHTTVDDTFYFTDDIWKLKNLDFPIKNSSTHPVESINFRRIKNSFKDEVKNVCLHRLRLVAVSSVKAEIFAISNFLTFFKGDDLKAVTRQDIEDYLVYLYTVDKRKDSYKHELTCLKSFFETLGHLTDTPSLFNLFLDTDYEKSPLVEYRYYTDSEMKRLNEAFKTLDEQTARLMFIHEFLGTRISDTLTLRSDCIDGDLITIDEPKVSRSYQKPIDPTTKALINASIAYTTKLYGPCEYIFVSTKDPTKPMAYSCLYNRLARMIKTLDLRNDNGELFGVNTHLFRHTYGKRLCDIGADDATIAKLLGHANTSSVKHYRRMSNQKLVAETERMRQKKDEKIREFKKGWE